MGKITHRKMVTVAMLVAVLLVAIDVTVVSTAMPRIVREFSGMSEYSWVFAIYTLTTCVTTPIYGKLADLFGRKGIFTLGVILFVLGSMLSGAAQNMTELIWFRAFQGIGAGAVMPVTFTIIGDLYPGEQRAKMQGVFGSVWGIAGLLGPLLGGFFVDQLTWRWIFYINLPFGIISIVLVLMFLHERFEKRTKKIDYLGAITFTISLSSLLYALLNGGTVNYSWTSPIILTLFAVFIVFFVLFIVVERTASEPMLPLSLFKIQTIAAANVVVFFLSFALIGANVYLPMWIQTLLGHSATSSGLTLMPMSIAWPIGGAIAGRYMYRIGSKTTAVLGAILVVLSAAWLLAVELGSPYWYFVGVMIVFGLGMGFAVTPTTVLVQSSVGWQMRGAATASNTLMRSLGQTVGVTIFGTVFNQAIANYFTSHPITGQKVNASNYTLLMNSSHALPPSVLQPLHLALERGLHDVFIVTLIMASVGLLSTILLPSHKKILEHQATVQGAN